MSERTISEDVLRGIADALQRHAPHLISILITLRDSGLIQPRFSQLGKSAFGKLTGSVAGEDGAAVLQALKEIEDACGYDAMFAGRQINFLVMEWRRFAALPQLPP